MRTQESLTVSFISVSCIFVHAHSVLHLTALLPIYSNYAVLRCTPLYSLLRSTA